MGEGNGWRGEGLRSINRLHNSYGDVNYNMGNGGAKELTCMTHGHDQVCGDCLRELGVLCGGGHSGKVEITIIA